MSEALKLAQEIVNRHTGCEGTKGCNVCQIPRALIDIHESHSMDLELIRLRLDSERSFNTALSIALTAAQERIRVLEGAIAGARHSASCKTRLMVVGLPCNCFKSVLAPKEPKS